MSTYVNATVRKCTSSAKNLASFIKKARPIQLFPATKPLESGAADIFGPLPKRKRGYVFILVISDRFQYAHTSHSEETYNGITFIRRVHRSLDLCMGRLQRVYHIIALIFPREFLEACVKSSESLTRTWLSTIRSAKGKWKGSTGPW